MTEKTFIEITNKDIYNEIKGLTKTIGALKTTNDIGHEQLIIHQMKTNGRVKLNKWIGTTALSLVTIIIIALVSGAV